MNTLLKEMEILIVQRGMLNQFTMLSHLDYQKLGHLRERRLPEIRTHSKK